MPYISQEERKELDPFIDKLIDVLKNLLLTGLMLD
jgi:hypothetical protein